MSESFTIEKTDKGLLIKFNDKATIQNIDIIYKSIRDKIKMENDLIIDINNISAVDLSFIQLMVAIQQTLKNNNKKCVIKGSFTPTDQQFLESAGLNISGSI